LKWWIILWLLAAGGQPEEQSVGLQQLLQAALEHDARLEAAAAQLDAYRAQLKEADWAWFPQIKFQALVGGPVGERRLACNPDRDPNCTGLEITPSSKTGDFDFGNLSFALGGKLEGVLPLYTFGKIDAARKAASAGVEAAMAQQLSARQQVALEVRRAYYGWLLADYTQEVLADGKQKIGEAEKKLIKMLDELSEEVTDRDLFKLRYYATQLDAWLERTRQGGEVALAALRFLTGRKELLAGKLAREELRLPEQAPLDRDRWLQQALSLRSELKMLQAAENASREAVAAARAQFYPDFFLAGYVEGSWSPVQDYIENPLLQPGLTRYDAALALGMRLTLDLPQKLARLEKARAELVRVQALLRQAREGTVLQVEQRLSELQEAWGRYQIKRKARRSAEAWSRANLMSYGVGVFDTKDLLDSVAALALSSIELEQTKHDVQLALDFLRAVCGEDLGVANAGQ